MMFCHKCGTQISEGEVFCHKCGTKVVSADSETDTSGISVSNTVNDVIQAESVPNMSDVDASSEGNVDTSAECKIEEIATEPNQTQSAETNDNLTKKEKDKSVLKTCFKVIIAIIVLIIVINLIKELLASGVILIVAAIGYVIYEYWIAEIIMRKTYENSDQTLQLPEDMDSQAFFESLSGKFNYPYFKGIRYNEKGTCLIEGKHGEYPVKFYGIGNADLDYIEPEEKKHIRFNLQEAMIIRSYINKFFNPSLPYDAMTDFKKFKSAEKRNKATGLVISAASAIIVFVLILNQISPNTTREIIQPGASVRNAYLSQYNDKVTIEEAFDNFFEKCSWSTYKDEAYSYVAFTGVCKYDDENVDVRITFKLTGDNFRVDSLDMNGVEQSDLLLLMLLEEVYAEYEST